jgi:type IV secretory pathway TrbD component
VVEGLTGRTVSMGDAKASREENVGLILIILVLALLFGVLGFALHVLWIIAAVLLVCWLVGLALGHGRRSART